MHPAAEPAPPSLSRERAPDHGFPTLLFRALAPSGCWPAGAARLRAGLTCPVRAPAPPVLVVPSAAPRTPRNRLGLNRAPPRAEPQSSSVAPAVLYPVAAPQQPLLRASNHAPDLAERAHDPVPRWTAPPSNRARRRSSFAVTAPRPVSRPFPRLERLPRAVPSPPCLPGRKWLPAGAPLQMPCFGE